MSNYVESKKTLDKIRNEYGCKGDVLFRTALQLVVSAGQCTVLDDGWYQCEIDDIHEKHNKAETEGKLLFIGRDFELAILECARELAEVDAYDLLIYVQKEVWLSGEGMDYQRAIELLKRCIEQIEVDENYNNTETYDVLQSIGFDDDELEEFGYGYLLEESDEEE